MSFIFTCPSCSGSLTGEEQHEGGQSVCPLCSASIVIQRNLGVDEASSSPTPTPQRGGTIEAPELLSARGKLGDLFSNVTRSSRLMASLAVLQIRRFYEKWFRLVPKLRAIGITLIQQGSVTQVSQKLAHEVDSISSKISDDYAKEEQSGLSECLSWKEKVGSLCRRAFFRVRIVTFSFLRHVKAVAIGDGAVSSSTAHGIASEQINSARVIKEGIDRLNEKTRQVKSLLPLPLRQPLLVVVIAGLCILAAIDMGGDPRRVPTSPYNGLNEEAVRVIEWWDKDGDNLLIWTETLMRQSGLSSEDASELVAMEIDTLGIFSPDKISSLGGRARAYQDMIKGDLQRIRAGLWKGDRWRKYGPQSSSTSRASSNAG